MVRYRIHNQFVSFFQGMYNFCFNQIPEIYLPVLWATHHLCITAAQTTVYFIVLVNMTCEPKSGKNCSYFWTSCLRNHKITLLWRNGSSGNQKGELIYLMRDRPRTLKNKCSQGIAIAMIIGFVSHPNSSHCNAKKIAPQFLKILLNAWTDNKQEPINYLKQQLILVSVYRKSHFESCNIPTVTLENAIKY